MGVKVHVDDLLTATTYHRYHTTIHQLVSWHLFVTSVLICSCSHLQKICRRPLNSSKINVLSQRIDYRTMCSGAEPTGVTFKWIDLFPNLQLEEMRKLRRGTCDVNASSEYISTGFPKYHQRILSLSMKFIHT